VKLTDIAARLRMASAEMNALAALTEDTDWPDEFVPAFILNFVLDGGMFPALLRAGAKQRDGFDRAASGMADC
jgi:hypothetical protein